MTEFTFQLLPEDADRLFSLKAEAGKDELTGNEYARELLEDLLHRLHPEKVQYDDVTGDMIPRKGAQV